MAETYYIMEFQGTLTKEFYSLIDVKNYVEYCQKINTPIVRIQKIVTEDITEQLL